VAAPTVPVNTGAPAITTPGGITIETDRWKNPYNKMSAHHRPVGAGVTGKRADLNPGEYYGLPGTSVVPGTRGRMANVTAINLPGPVGIKFRHKVVAGDTLTTIGLQPDSNPDGSIPFSLKIPLGATYPPGVEADDKDNNVLFWPRNGISTPGALVDYFNQFVVEGGYSARYRREYNLDELDYQGDGDLQDKGAGASRMRWPSSMLLYDEWSPASPGPIRHCIHCLGSRVGIPNSQQLLGRDSFWPSHGTDSMDANSNNGDVPYGTRFVIRWQDRNLRGSLGLSARGLRLFDLLLGFGYYVLDGGNEAGPSGGCKIDFRTDQGQESNGAWAPAIKQDMIDQLTILVPLCWPVRNIRSLATESEVWSDGLPYASGGGPLYSDVYNSAYDAPATGGVPTVGTVATCSNGTWSNSPTGYIYQWRRNGTNIAGATAATYTIVSADIDTALTCAVLASNANGPAAAPAISNTLIPVGTAPVNTVAPVISVNNDGWYAGNLASCTSGTWSNTPTAYGYQWYRGSTAISGATAATYTIQVADIAADLKCNVVATNSGGSAAIDSDVKRVRWSPEAEVAAGTVLRWLDVYDQARVVRTGALVSQVTARVGSNAVQATSAVQPSFVAADAAFDNHPVITFTGTATGPFLEAPLSFSGSIFMSLVVGRIISGANTVGGSRIVAFANTGVADNSTGGLIPCQKDGGNSGHRAGFGATNVIETGVLVGSPVITLARGQAAQKTFSANGRTPIVSAGAAAVTVTRGAIGSSLSGATYSTTRGVMDFCESVFLTVDDDTIADKLVGYAAWRWAASLVTALPAGHPYKSAAP
jgi:hypothetical protein